MLWVGCNGVCCYVVSSDVVGKWMVVGVLWRSL